MGGIGIWQLLIVLLIVVMLFGTKRLKGLGADLGDAIKGFRNSVNSADDANKQMDAKPGQTIDGEARKVEEPQKKD